MIDRRKRRSRIPQEALTLYLEAAAARSGAAAAALATGDGLLLGGAGADHDLDRLAAAGVRCARGAASDGALDEGLDAATRGEDLYASLVTVCGAPCYLASIGARLSRQRALAADLDRILGPALSR